MSFSEADRVQIRIYLGYAELFLQADPRLESAITASQSLGDGGTRPTSDAENAIKATVTTLQGIDASILNLSNQQGALQAGNIKIDSARELARLQATGEMYVSRLARFLDTEPRSNSFRPALGNTSSYPNDPRAFRNAYTAR